MCGGGVRMTDVWRRGVRMIDVWRRGEDDCVEEG